MHRKQRMKETQAVKEIEVEDGSFYERIMRLGHGPPEGIKLDRAGWRWYFDQMHDIKRLQLVREVFGDVLPKEWRPRDHEIRVEWLDGVDKDVTSRSEAFAKVPRYQYIWQNGYGPENGDQLDIEGWEKYMAEMPEEKRKKMDNDLFDIPSDPDHDKLWNKYVRQIHESEGFDVDVRISVGGSPIVPMFDDMSQANHDERLRCYSMKAVHAYNVKESTDYTLTRVVKACKQAVSGGVMYYITFEGVNPENHTQVFQAKVHELPNMPVEIKLVRPKPTGSSFYNRIIRAGYGPPDGVKLDSPQAWRGYFDGMDSRELFCLIRKVFADDLPKAWNPRIIRVEWLDGVDKDVTSRSPPFRGCPRYQYIWQNNYGPEDGDKLPFKDWVKYTREMPEEKCERMIKDLFFIPDDPVHHTKIWETYRNQVEKSQGFDVDVCVKHGSGSIAPMYYDMSEAKYDDRLIRYSRKALHVYNDREGTNYSLNEVVKACRQQVKGSMYYVTFEAASDSGGDIKGFQAEVLQPPMNSKEEIVLVRLKP